MQVIYRIDPPLPVMVGSRKATAHAWMDYGTDYDLMWLVAYDDTGEFWILKNSLIRQVRNDSMRARPLGGTVDVNGYDHI